MNRTHAPAEPARGVTRDGAASFRGLPSPTLVGHERVHVAQQRLGRAGFPTAPTPALEAEAARLAPRLAAGRPADVRLAAPPAQPLHGTDPDMTFTSTVGLVVDDQYIKGAHEYHEKWGYKPIKVGSVEEVTAELAKGTGTLSRIRIVSHASQMGLYMQFAKGTPDNVLEAELAATTPAAAEQAGVEATAMYADDGALENFREKVETSDSALAGRLGITKGAAISSATTRDYFRWLVNKHRAEKAPGLSAGDVALILPKIKAHVATARTAAVAGGTSAADLDSLKTIIEGYGFGWSAVDPLDALGEAASRAHATNEAFTSRDFAGNQTKAKARFTKDSVIEIRGCAIGQSKSYMTAVQSYFGSAAGKPAVNAPDWYQFYGKLGLLTVPNSDDQLKGYWKKYATDLKTSLTTWAPIFNPGQVLPAAPTWADLATYLRAGHALPIRGGSRLFTLKDMGEAQLVDWFTKNEQRLSAAADIQKQFAPLKLSDEVTKSYVVQWLQKDYSDPKTSLFSYDPAFAAHFIDLPGTP